MTKRKISYDPLWKKLIDMKISRGQLCEMASISRSTVTKMGKDEYVALDIIEKICSALDCDVSDILEAKRESGVGHAGLATESEGGLVQYSFKSVRDRHVRRNCEG